jgi:glutathione S-transferase
MYTLYYSPGACSLAVHALLNEMGASFEAINVKEEKNRPAFLKANPRAMVPTVMVEGKPLTEGAAILTYLADTHKSALLPQAGWERAKTLEWLAFANSTLHPKYGACFGALYKLGMKPEDAAKEKMLVPVLDSIQKCWDEVEQALSSQGTPYLVGDKPTVADVLLTVIANWSPMMPRTVTFGPKTKAFFGRVSSLPYYAKAMEAEQVQYKVAA